MWKELKAVHFQKKHGIQFNAYGEFFSIHMAANKSLLSLIPRINVTVAKLRNMRSDTF